MGDARSIRKGELPCDTSRASRRQIQCLDPVRFVSMDGTPAAMDLDMS